MASTVVVTLLSVPQDLKPTGPAAIAFAPQLGVGPLRILTKLRLPMVMPTIINGLRVGMIRSALVVIASETFGTYRGLDWSIYELTQQTDFLGVWTAVFTALTGSPVL